MLIKLSGIMNGCASSGLQLYRFGETISICFWTKRWKPESYYDKLLFNRKHNQHTLCLLDIKVKEQSEENMMKGIFNVFEPPRFMSVNQCLEQLKEIDACRPEGERVFSDVVVDPESGCEKRGAMCVGIARLGAKDQQIVAGTLDDLIEHDFGEPLHALVVAAPELHECETEFLELLSVTNSNKAGEAKDGEERARKKSGLEAAAAALG